MSIIEGSTLSGSEYSFPESVDQAIQCLRDISDEFSALGKECEVRTSGLGVFMSMREKYTFYISLQVRTDDCRKSVNVDVETEFAIAKRPEWKIVKLSPRDLGKLDLASVSNFFEKNEQVLEQIFERFKRMSVLAKSRDRYVQYLKNEFDFPGFPTDEQ